MLFVGSVAILVCIFLITIILTEPSIPIGEGRIPIKYWMAPLIGALILTLFGKLSLSEIWHGLTATGSINPLKILVLFISMTMLSIFLDEAGMFSYLAGIALSHAGSSQKKLFLYLYIMVSVLTVFTSNDIIILTFTPFICYFSKNAKINPIPYLFGEFVAANTWSMMLVIGNPTNIYLASSAGITFGGYTFVMLFPTVMAGIAAFLLLFLLFRKDLSAPLNTVTEKKGLEYPLLTAVGVVHLALCTILLVLSSYIGLEMWLITLCFAISLFICVSICGSRFFRYLIRHILFYNQANKQKETGKFQNLSNSAAENKPSQQEKVIKRYTGLNRKHTSIHLLAHTLRRAPWELIPFVLSMFLMVLALDKYGFMALAADLLGPKSDASLAANQTSTGLISILKYEQSSTGLFTILKYGLSSFAAANVMNNIPMAVAFSAITSHLSGFARTQAVYASIIGSNIGAFFTPLGALAGIMWAGILKRLGVDFSFKKYISLGARVSILTILAALLSLALVL